MKVACLFHWQTVLLMATACCLPLAAGARQVSGSTGLVPASTRRAPSGGCTGTALPSAPAAATVRPLGPPHYSCAVLHHAPPCPCPMQLHDASSGGANATSGGGGWPDPALKDSFVAIDGGQFVLGCRTFPISGFNQ